MGDPFDNVEVPGNPADGAVWVFTRGNGVWTQQLVILQHTCPRLPFDHDGTAVVYAALTNHPEPRVGKQSNR